MNGGGDLRVSDADRDRAAAELREHYALGRLSADELNERVDAALAARTERDLAAVGHDLPELPPTPEALRQAFAERRLELRRKLVRRTGASMVPSLVVILIWTQIGVPLWFGAVAVVMFLWPLLHGLWGLYGPHPDLDEAEREILGRRPGDRDGTPDQLPLRDQLRALRGPPPRDR